VKNSRSAECVHLANFEDPGKNCKFHVTGSIIAYLYSVSIDIDKLEGGKCSQTTQLIRKDVIF